MCGRYAAAKDTAALVEQYGIAEVVEPAPAANYNVAPTLSVPMVVAHVADGRRELRQARWGLVPSWAKDVKVGARMINARWESLADRPAFRTAFVRRRAVLPADGFYEWYRPASGPKQPFFIHRRDGQSLALAAIFDFWRPDPQAPMLVSAAILTTAAVGALAVIHDRMPVVVPEEAIEAWLDRDHPYPGPQPSLPEQLWTAHPVAPKVNSTATSGPDLLAAVAAPDIPAELARLAG